MTEALFRLNSILNEECETLEEKCDRACRFLSSCFDCGNSEFIEFEPHMLAAIDRFDNKRDVNPFWTKEMSTSFRQRIELRKTLIEKRTNEIMSEMEKL